MTQVATVNEGQLDTVALLDNAVRRSPTNGMNVMGWQDPRSGVFRTYLLRFPKER